MNKAEFEAIAKRTVTEEQYKAIENLYMSSDLGKYEFVKSIKGLLKSIPEEDRRPVKVLNFCNAYGDYKTPNGCYYLTFTARLVNVDIRSGKAYWEAIPKSFELRTYFEHRITGADIVAGDWTR